MAVFVRVSLLGRSVLGDSLGALGDGMMLMAFDEMPVSGCTCLLDFQLWLSLQRLFFSSCDYGRDANSWHRSSCDGPKRIWHRGNLTKLKTKRKLFSNIETPKMRVMDRNGELV